MKARLGADGYCSTALLCPAGRWCPEPPVTVLLLDLNDLSCCRPAWVHRSLCLKAQLCHSPVLAVMATFHSATYAAF